MNRIFNLLFLSVFLVLVILAGCSSDQKSPTAAGLPDENSDSNNFSPVGVTDWNPDGSPAAGAGIMGLFSVQVDPASMAADITPLRKSSLTDVLEVVDITNFLSLVPCQDCVKLKSISITPEGYPALKIGIRHPFKAGDIFKPISGQNRGDLHVFNVEGIVLSDADVSSFPGTGQMVAKFKLLNADGYTGYLDRSIDTFFTTGATIHPYITHFDDYSSGNFSPANPYGFQSVTTPPPSGNLVMPMGSDYDFKDYVFDIDGSFSFMFAVGCTYGVSAASKSQRFSPEYRVPQHNKKAASEVSIEILNNQLRGGISASTADLEIHVVDISHNVAVGTALNEMLAESSVGEINVEIPGITGSPVVIAGNSAISGTGHSPADPLVYQTTITNVASGPEGTYTGLVKVRDTYLPGNNQSPLLNGKDGIARVAPGINPLTATFDISEFVTYQVFSIDVSTGCGPITGSIDSPACPITGKNNNDYISFTVSASSGNGGDPITLYEVDFDYDGIIFTPDDSNTDGIFTGVGPFTVPDPCASNIPHTFTVAFRATDSCSNPNLTIFATCDVTVEQCLPSLKNIPLRSGEQPNDLAVTPEGDLLIVYDDGQVWKYYETNYFQQTAADYLFTAEVAQWSNYQPPPLPVLAKDFIDVSDSGDIFASNADGNICNYPEGNFPAQSFSPTGSPIGEGCTPCTGGPVKDVFCYKSGTGGYFLDHVLVNSANGGNLSNMYRHCHLGWYWVEQYGTDCHGSGFDKMRGIDVVAAEAASIDQFWTIEDTPDYYCSRFIQDTFFNYHYNNAYFGTGTKTDEDTCWNEAKDLTMDSRGYMYVLDKLSSGVGVVKGFSGSSTGGTSFGHFNVPDSISSNPLRMEGSSVEGALGNLVFILHGDASDGYYLSVFQPAEIPW